MKEDRITREQLATILYRYAQYKDYDVTSKQSVDLNTFVDGASVNSYAVSALEWTCNAGLISGLDDGRLAPQGSATRGQVAAILHRFCKNMA